VKEARKRNLIRQDQKKRNNKIFSPSSLKDCVSSIRQTLNTQKNGKFYILRINFPDLESEQNLHSIKKKKHARRGLHKNHLLKSVNGASRTGRRLNKWNEQLYDWMITISRKVCNQKYIPTKKEIENFFMSFNLLDRHLNHSSKSYKGFFRLIWKTRRIMNLHSSKRKCTFYNVDTGALADKQSILEQKSFKKLSVSSAGQVPVIGPFLGRVTT